MADRGQQQAPRLRDRRQRRVPRRPARRERQRARHRRRRRDRGGARVLSRRPTAGPRPSGRGPSGLLELAHVMSRQPQPEAELARYLALLAGREPAGGLLEIRYRHPDRHQRMRQRWHPAAHPARAAREILELAGHTDVYVGVTPRRHRHGGRSAIRRAWVLWADLDQPDPTDPISRVPVAPGVVISSGTPGHRHLYWPLIQPLSVSQVEPANGILARALRADSGAVLNAATILRPPGTHNFKHGHPTAVTLERFEPRAHTAAQIRSEERRVGKECR